MLDSIDILIRGIKIQRFYFWFWKNSEQSKVEHKCPAKLSGFTAILK